MGLWAVTEGEPCGRAWEHTGSPHPCFSCEMGRGCLHVGTGFWGLRGGQRQEARLAGEHAGAPLEVLDTSPRNRGDQEEKSGSQKGREQSSQ